MVPYALLCTIVIFLVCCLVECVRQWVFRTFRITPLLDRISDRLQSWVMERSGRIR